MYKAELYSKNNVLQIRDAAYVLNKFSGSIKWQANEKILDIGCGDGRVTLEVLLPNLPKNFEKLIGVDLSTEMVKFAEESSKNSKVSFKQLDISSKKFPNEFKQEFHHIFSFYCLHWILDQKTVFQNFYDMLKPGGGFLVTILGYNPIYAVYERMVKSSRWAPYMKNLKEYVSPYHRFDEPEKEVKKMLDQLGFVVHSCKAEKLYYEYPTFAILKKIISAVNPFLKNIPDNEINDYFSDFWSEVRKLDTVTIKPCNNNNEESVGFVYKLLVVHASKPF